MSNEENIAKLEKLLEAGVITQEEFDIKKAELTSEPTEEELSELNDLLKKDLISKDEFEALKAKKKKDAVAAVTVPKAAPEAETVVPESFVKKNLVFLIIIAVLVVALGIIGGLFAMKQNELQEQLKTEKQTAYKYKCEAYSYKDMLTYFYLDNAVLVVDELGNTYHRYECPLLPASFTYRLFNQEAAKAEGYSECPTCFGVDADEFLEKYVKDEF